jgi:drug/metabolite transporter (DMT)-like permease
MHQRSSLSETPARSLNTSTNLRSPAAIRRGISVDLGNGERSSSQRLLKDAHPEPIQALPGRPRRRKASGRQSRRHSSGLFLSGMPQRIWILCCTKGSNLGSTASLFISVLLWYSLGVCSIASSKLLLTGSVHSGSIRVYPLTLTLQQLFIGSTMLRVLLEIRFLGSSGYKPWPRYDDATKGHVNGGDTVSSPQGRRELFMAAMCFALGFLATNYGFSGSAASFVETVKAAEPLTSATVAAVYGIETITLPQKISLGTIVLGVLVSTLGSGGNSSQKQTYASGIAAATIVMISNLCFSFRGLYQKLLRLHTSSATMDDLNLQFRMQWLGVLALVTPAILFDFLHVHWIATRGPAAAEYDSMTERHLEQANDSPPSFGRYCALALFNGVAFTSYNLASTYILSRITVVHHAALNCIRRVFAIVVTSVIFGVPITITGAIGICIAIVGFMAYTHYKVQQQLSLQSHSPTEQQRQSRQQISSLLPVTISK